MGEPSGEYRQRRARHQDALTRAESVDAGIAWARLLVFGLGLVLGGLVVTDRAPGASVGGAAAAFAILVAVHGRFVARVDRARRAVALWQHGLDRLDERWPTTTPNGGDLIDAHHPYARDVDLVGEGSLFSRLCLCRTRPGDRMLASWLLAPAPPDEIRARQRAITALKDRLDLRESFALAGPDGRMALDPHALRSWAEAPAQMPPSRRVIRAAAIVLALLGTGALVAWFTGRSGAWPLVGIVIVDVLVLRVVRPAIDRVSAGFRRPGEQLRLLTVLLARIEAESFEDPMLMTLRAALSSDGRAASTTLASLARRMELMDWTGNQFFAPLAFLWLWPLQLAYGVEEWRLHHGARLAAWLDAVGRFEALSSLATYAYEHPADPFPEIVEGEAIFDGQSLGHPLLPAPSCVRNNVCLDGKTPMLLISGSNMSGKSTLLRTVGVNAVLAFCGAPVRATRLRIGVMSIAASLRVEDSLQEGRSRFMAEVLRLKQVMDLTPGPLPVLFLLDEILHGTNSHDRKVGAEALMAALLERGALGLVTTHDLALAQAASSLGEKARNMHFQDDVIDGKMVFDYRMRDGIVHGSNALRLMRQVGLPV